jgi:signal transduction histidine kinase
MKNNFSSKITDLSCLLPSDNRLEGLVRDEVCLHKIEKHFQQLIQNQQDLISNIKKIHAMLSREENEINFINLYDLIERVIHMLENVDHHENIDAVVYNEGKDSFYGNELILFSMITSIIKNSIEYRTIGPLKHWIRVVINDTKQGKQITFFDNGRGVKKELQEEAFYLTKQSVLQLRGSLEISSDTNTGTVIICRIPSKKE